MDTQSETRRKNRWSIKKKRRGGGNKDDSSYSNYDYSMRNGEDVSEKEATGTPRSIFRRPSRVKKKDEVSDSEALRHDHDRRVQSLKEKKSRLSGLRKSRGASSSDDGSEFTDKGSRDGIRVSLLRRIPVSKMSFSRKSSSNDGAPARKGVKMARSEAGMVVGGLDFQLGGDSAHNRNCYSDESGDLPSSGVSFAGGTMSRESSTLNLRGDVGGRSIEGASFHTPGERARYSIHHGSRGGKRKFRVRPYHCFDQPAYMTEEDIYTDSLKPSTKCELLKSYIAPSLRLDTVRETHPNVSEVWGSPEDDGRIGAFRVEVLGCISLGRTKPDVSVYCVCGDSVFVTDVLTGYRSPMWPCNSKRAGVFPIHHAYAKLFVGVFDVRARKNSDNDVFCGRVSIDISSIRPDTEYDITLPLRASTFVYDRKPRGVIRMRFALHWFNERSAVFSYFKGPKSMARDYPLVKGNPAIPCADPKTFRNLAFTVYGQDLPGKYTRTAFRATMREFNLYQMNLRHLVKTLILDAVMYRKPLISLYLFIAGMHCAISSSIRMVPPLSVGYLLVLLISNHRHFVQREGYNLSYKPLTLWELLLGCLFVYQPECPSFNQIFLQKRTKKRKVKTKANQQLRRLNSIEGKNDETDPAKEVEIIPLDHREFPYSDRDAYPKLAVEDSLVASTKGGSRRASTSRMHGRLSVYYTTADPSEMEVEGKEEEEDSDDDGNESDNETVMTETNMGDNLFDVDFDNDDSDDEDEMEAPVKRKSGHGSLGAEEEEDKKNRIRVGPPQNSETRSSKKIPPQVHLLKVEKMLHKVSFKIAHEMVHPAEGYGESEKGKGKSASGGGASKKKSDISSSLKKKRPQMDEFDKKLALHTSSVNPVTRIASSFLGPLMRMIRVFIYITRVFFNIYTWRDPYMTFWVFMFLVVWCIFLIWFPWRTFFLIFTLAALGPQNLFIRIYLEKKKASKKKKEEEAKLATLKENEDGYGYETAVPQSASSHEEKKKDKANGPKKENLFKRLFANKDDLPEYLKVPRPPFRADGKATSSSKVQPRCVVVPYTRFKKERFFDWPPDPTVSRATPLPPLVDYFMENLDDNYDGFDLDNESTCRSYDHDAPMFEFDPSSDFPGVQQQVQQQQLSSDFPGVTMKQPKFPIASDFPGVSSDFPGVNFQSMDFPGISSSIQANNDDDNDTDHGVTDFATDLGVPEKVNGTSELRHRKPHKLESKKLQAHAHHSIDEDSYKYQDDWSD